MTLELRGTQPAFGERPPSQDHIFGMGKAQIPFRNRTERMAMDTACLRRHAFGMTCFYWGLRGDGCAYCPDGVHFPGSAGRGPGCSIKAGLGLAFMWSAM